LALRWQTESPHLQSRVIEGTLAFADISGFTRLAELLAASGKAGAEELTSVLDATFAELLKDAYDFGGELVKWGGDAVLLFYTGADHASRAVASATAMQRTIRRVGRLRTSVGRSTLRLSVGIHSGGFHFFMAGNHHRELLITGPAATVTAEMEAIADAGEIMGSKQVTDHLDPRAVGAAKGPGRLVASTLPMSPYPSVGPAATAPASVVERSLNAALRDHLLAGPVESEHRQVAVGFIEFRGVDALLARKGADEVAAVLDDLVTRIQASCARHAVTFWETDIGRDGGKVMLVAGAPNATDDDAGRLIVVGREVLDGGGVLQLRVGINHGRVFAGNFGPPYRRTYSVKGDAVNLAARLMASADAGQLIASTAAVRRSRVTCEADELAPFLVKGKREPVRACRIGRIGTPQQAEGSHRLPLVGRAAELELLSAHLLSTRQGHGAFVELVGEPGIGKSRLIDEITARASGHLVLKAQCDEYSALVPYAQLRVIGRRCLGIDAAVDQAQAGAALTDCVRRQAPELMPWLPLLAVVIDATVLPTAEASALDERFRRARLSEAFVELLAAVLRQPTLIVVDDVQRMDDASCDVLRRIAADVEPLPWLVLVGRHPQSVGLSVADLPGVVRLELQALPHDAVAQLVRTATEAQPLAPHQSSAVVSRSGGNPLFLLELLSNTHTMHASKSPGASPSGDNSDELPATVEGVFAAQIDRLAPPDRQLLRVASVLGAQVSLPVLSAMLDPPLSRRQLTRLQEFLVPDTADTLRFRHGLLRDAAYEGLPFARRRELHARAGAVLEQRAGARASDIAGLLAVHFGIANRHDAAWHYARVAAQRAREMYANAEAAAFFERALDSGRANGVATAADLLAVAEALGDVRTRLGEFKRAEQTYRLARRWATPGLDRARLHYKVALVADRAGNYPQTLRMLGHAERALADTSGHGAARLRAEIRAEQGLVRHRQGRGGDAVRALLDAVWLATAAGEQDVIAMALVHLDAAELAIGQQGTGEHASRALEILRSVGELPWLEARALNQLGIRAYFAGRWAEAVAYYEDSRMACERAGDQWTAAIESANIAEVLSDQGHLAEAEPILDEALRTYRAAGTPTFVAGGTWVLGRLAARRGDVDRARMLISSARDLYASNGEQLEVALTESGLAECALFANEPALACQIAEKTLTALTSLPGGGLVLPLLQRVHGLALAALGADEAARQALRSSIEAARARQARYELALSLQAVADMWPSALSDDERAERDALFDQLGVVESARRLWHYGTDAEVLIKPMATSEVSAASATNLGGNQ
jgi:predicted ATPase